MLLWRSLQVDHYTYEMCPYGSAQQKEGGGGTSLGTFAGFDSTHSSFSFTNGLQCWNGPTRSLKVDLVCGEANSLSEVREPNRCEYQARFETPAACTEAGLKAARAALEEAQAEAAKAGTAELHDELR